MRLSTISKRHGSTTPKSLDSSPGCFEPFVSCNHQSERYDMRVCGTYDCTSQHDDHDTLEAVSTTSRRALVRLIGTDISTTDPLRRTRTIPGSFSWIWPSRHASSLAVYPTNPGFDNGSRLFIDLYDCIDIIDVFNKEIYALMTCLLLLAPRPLKRGSLMRLYRFPCSTNLTSS
jgi:hypothetical protein